MSQAQIELALFDKLEAIKASLPTIYYPNSPNKNKPNPPTGEHIRVSVLNARYKRNRHCNNRPNARHYAMFSISKRRNRNG